MEEKCIGGGESGKEVAKDHIEYCKIAKEEFDTVAGIFTDLRDATVEASEGIEQRIDELNTAVFHTVCSGVVRLSCVFL